jgi:hypothetical protein
MGWKFASYTSVYANPQEFRRTLSSVADKVDLMIVHIGRYSGYDEKEILKSESDKVFDIAREYGCEIIISPAMSELDKRRMTPLIAKRKDVDFLLIIDSDEYLDKMESNWDRFRGNCIDIAVNKYHGQYNIFGIRVEDGNQTYRVMPRLWYQPEFVYYDNTHYGLKSGNPRCPYNMTDEFKKAAKHPLVEMIPFLTIRSDTNLRTDYQKENRSSYEYVLNNLDNTGLVSRK